jgi:hypothetical protein
MLSEAFLSLNVLVFEQKQWLSEASKSLNAFVYKKHGGFQKVLYPYTRI